jgi:hypothetical protein
MVREMAEEWKFMKNLIYSIPNTLLATSFHFEKTTLNPKTVGYHLVSLVIIGTITTWTKEYINESKLTPQNKIQTQFSKTILDLGSMELNTVEFPIISLTLSEI